MHSLERFKEELDLTKRLRKKDLLKVCFKDLTQDESLPTLADSYYLIMYLIAKHDVR